MVTTIQISENLRDDLLKFKDNSKKSYEDIIRDLLDNFKEEMREEEKLLIQGYKEMAEMTLEMNKEWEVIDLEEMKNIK